MNRQTLKGGIKREREISTKERYIEAQERYLNGEFTSDTHSLIQNLTEKGKREPNMEGVQIYKILIEIAKILLMNELEMLFLGATLEEMKWSIIDPSLNNYINDFKVLKSNLKTDNYSKKVQLSLLLIGYIVKVYLNDSEEIAVFESKIREFMVKDYDRMYQEWVEKMKKNFKFSPKNMNKLFREMDVIRTSIEEELDEANYNIKVEELIKNFAEPEVKYEREEIREPYINEVDHESPVQPPPPFGNIQRTESGFSLRSLGNRRQSEISERDYGFGLKNMSSIFRQTSGFDDQ